MIDAVSFDIQSKNYQGALEMINVPTKANPPTKYWQFLQRYGFNDTNEEDNFYLKLARASIKTNKLKNTDLFLSKISKNPSNEVEK